VLSPFTRIAAVGRSRGHSAVGTAS
jgi:hypothetical protein